MPFDSRNFVKLFVSVLFEHFQHTDTNNSDHLGHYYRDQKLNLY